MVCVPLEERTIDGVHIWRAALDEAGWPGPERLPDPERQRAATFLHEEACRRWVAARWALRRALEGYLEEPAAEIELEEGERGKPRLRRAVGIEFNLSHSGGLALVAVTEGRQVGVDVEMVEPARDLTALATRALPPDDAAAVREAPPPRRPDVFYPAWVRHEARLKCLGLGLGAKTNRRTSTAEEGNRRFANEDELLAVSELDVAPGYAAAVAVAAAVVGPVECRS